MTRVLVVAADVVGQRMAGPGIRAWEMARTLGDRHQVTLAAPPPLPAAATGFEIVEAARSGLRGAAAAAQVVIAQPVAFSLFPVLLESEARKVVDAYDPALIEGLELHAGEAAPERLARHGEDLQSLRVAVQAGDFFLCASERQRQYWIGVLAALGRVNPLTYAADPTLRNLLAVVPFGIPEQPPAPGRARLRDGQAIGAEDPVVIWAGGIWDWFDPQTLVRAVAGAGRELPNLRLVFMGAGHPNPSVGQPAAAGAAPRLARELGLEGKHVFFRRGWVPYAERGSLLLEADAGAVLHRDTVESGLALRTRVLDHLWAGLPSIVTAGDAMADLVEAEKLGVVVPPGSEAAVSAALVKVLGDRAFAARCRKSVQRVAVRYHWSRVLEPVAAFCDHPIAAADREVLGRAAALPRSGLPVRRAWHSLRRDGPRQFARRAYRYLRRRTG
ncbi:MAG TPA: glycosyltransferase family 4 protein [Candidatus Dormibacteraeota bacterium]